MSNIGDVLQIVVEMDGGPGGGRSLALKQVKPCGYEFMGSV